MLFFETLNVNVKISIFLNYLFQYITPSTDGYIEYRTSNPEKNGTSGNDLEIIEPSVENVSDENQTGGNGSEPSFPDSFWQYQQDPEQILNKSVTTRDLISWSFQVARGMDYLESRKVSL